MADLDSIEAQLEALDAKIDAIETKIELERELAQVCPVCAGTGVLVEVTDVGQGKEENEVTCWKCEGATKINWGFQEAL